MLFPNCDFHQISTKVPLIYMIFPLKQESDKAKVQNDHKIVNPYTVNC